MSDLLTAVLLTPFSLKEPDWVTRIVDVWMREAPDLYPEFADYKEPIRRPVGYPLTADDLIRLRAGWMARRAKPRMQFLCTDSLHWHAMVKIRVDEARPGRFVDPIVRWTDTLATMMEADFGFVHVLTHEELVAEPDRPDVVRPYRDGREAGAGIVIAGATLQYGLATLYWRTYLGPLYVDLIGASAIEALPAYRVESTRWGYAVQLTEEPPGVTPWPEYLAAREMVIGALGQEFFRADRGSYTAGIGDSSRVADRAARVPDLHGAFRTKSIENVR